MESGSRINQILKQKRKEKNREKIRKKRENKFILSIFLEA